MLACAVSWANLAITLELGTGSLVSAIHETSPAFVLGAGQVSQSALRDALLDTDPATAFDPFLNFTAHNTRAARARVYIELHNTGVFEWPLGYATVNGNLFNLPAGPVSFAIGGEYHGRESGSIVTQLVTRSTRLAQMDKASR